jgi:hypothetical protein
LPDGKLAAPSSGAQSQRERVALSLILCPTREDEQAETSQGGPFERTRGPVTSALAQSSSALRELGQVWRDAEAQLVELRLPAALDAGQLKL